MARCVEELKVVSVTSCGGHLDEVQAYLIHLNCSVDYVINVNVDIGEPSDRVYTITHSARDLKFIFNLYELYKIFRQKDYDLLITTGASPGVWAIIVAKAMGIEAIYIESVTRVRRLSLSGYIAQFICQNCFTPHDEIISRYPKYKKIEWMFN
jgi:UDP-N-acetylglucosamine:LPS N-acetylglucosamine transferase